MRRRSGCKPALDAVELAADRAQLVGDEGAEVVVELFEVVEQLGADVLPELPLPLCLP